MKNNEIKDEKTDKFKIKILKIISTIVCFIGAALVTIFIKLNFVTLAVIAAVITFSISLEFEMVRKVLNFIINKADKNKDRNDI